MRRERSDVIVMPKAWGLPQRHQGVKEMARCSFCMRPLDLGRKWGRADLCPHCGKDLRSCKQCKFYDPRAFNECGEVSAGKIQDKERANLCEYFLPKGTQQSKVNRAQDAREALEALFRK